MSESPGSFGEIFQKKKKNPWCACVGPNNPTRCPTTASRHKFKIFIPRKKKKKKTFKNDLILKMKRHRSISLPQSVSPPRSPSPSSSLCLPFSISHFDSDLPEFNNGELHGSRGISLCLCLCLSLSFCPYMYV